MGLVHGLLRGDVVMCWYGVWGLPGWCMAWCMGDDVWYMYILQFQRDYAALSFLFRESTQPPPSGIWSTVVESSLLSDQGSTTKPPRLDLEQELSIPAQLSSWLYYGFLVYLCTIAVPKPMCKRLLYPKEGRKTRTQLGHLCCVFGGSLLFSWNDLNVWHSTLTVREWSHEPFV